MKAKKLLAFFLTVAMLSAFAAVSVAAMLGDATGDGDVNARDYIAVRRHVLGSYTLRGEALDSADVNGDGTVNARDYIIIKRHVLGTYTITDTPAEDTPIDKIVDAIGNKEKLSITYEGTIAGLEGVSEISFIVIDGVLNLHGHAVTDSGMIIDMYIPMPKVSKTYSFSGDATLEALGGKASGTLVAAEYSVDDTSIADLTFTDTGSVNLTDALTKKLNGLCKEAMDQFLYQANKLLIQENTGLTIKDLGFTKFYAEIEEGLMDL